MGLHGFADANWASEADRKSTSGQVWMLYGGPISWKSSRQSVVATSSTNAEYVAVSAASRECVWLIGLLGDMMIPIDRVTLKSELDDESIVLYSDNQGAIKLASHRVTNERSKHIDVCHHYIRGLVDSGKVVGLHCCMQAIGMI